MNGWINVIDTDEFPSRIGLYAFYGEKDKLRLYVGQRLNIRRRGLSHQIWRQTIEEFENPSAAYKVIEYEDFNRTKQ